MSRRFTEDDARRVFARAARRQHTAAAPPDGLTLEELQEIGRAAGLDPDQIAAAVAESDAEAEARETWHGVPVGVRRTRLLPGRLSDAEWERAVDLLRAEFKTSGAAQQIGRRREWVTRPGSTDAYRVVVDERPDGDLVTVEATSSYRLAGRLLLAIFGGIGLVLGLLIYVTKQDPTGLGLTALMTGIGVVLYGVLLLVAQLQATRLPSRFESVLDRIDLLSRADAAPPDRPALTAGEGGAVRLDLDALPEAGGAGAAALRRRDRA